MIRAADHLINPHASEQYHRLENTGTAFEENERVTATAILGGLHHEYGLEQIAA
jgi:hypothetical protein